MGDREVPAQDGHGYCEGQVKVGPAFLGESAKQRVHILVGLAFFLMMLVIMDIGHMHARRRLLTVHAEMNMRPARLHSQDCEDESP